MALTAALSSQSVDNQPLAVLYPFALLYFGLLNQPPAEYRTVTSPAPASPTSRGIIRAVFQPTLRVSDLQQLLEQSGLQIVSGPTEAGVYTLAGVSDCRSAEGRRRTVRNLRVCIRRCASLSRSENESAPHAAIVLGLLVLVLTLAGCASTLQDRIGNPVARSAARLAGAIHRRYRRERGEGVILACGIDAARIWRPSKLRRHDRRARAGRRNRARLPLERSRRLAHPRAATFIASCSRSRHRARRPDVLAELAHEPRVKIAQPLGTFHTMSQSGSPPLPPPAYNDPYVSLQKGFEKIDVADAHRWSRGDGEKVAIVDTGIDVSHPELKNRVAAARNFVDTDATQFRRDRHGTEVAGVIASLANNKLGIVGVAPGAKLIALKACWQLEAGADGARCNSFTLAKALVAAMDEGAQVVNLSLAGPTDPLLASLVESGVQRGIVFVGAVSPTPQQELSGFPGGASGMLAVDSSEEQAAKNGVLRRQALEILTLTPEGHFDFASGSSLATAHVTGTVALLLARNPKLRPDALQAVLSRTSTRSDDRSSHRTIESINACAAVASLSRQTGCEQAPRVADQDGPAATATAGSMR